MPTAEKIAMTLPPDMLQRLREAVAAGEYAPASGAIRDAVHAWQRERLEDAECLSALCARVAASLGDLSASLSKADVNARLAALFAVARTDNAG